MGKARPSPNIIDIKTVFLTDNAPQLWVGLLEAEELLGHQLGGGWLHEDIPGGGTLRPGGGHHAAHLSIDTQREVISSSQYCFLTCLLDTVVLNVYAIERIS